MAERRFDELFAASPRAKELFAAVKKKKSLVVYPPVTEYLEQQLYVPVHNEAAVECTSMDVSNNELSNISSELNESNPTIINMAEFFRNKNPQVVQNTFKRPSTTPIFRSAFKENALAEFDDLFSPHKIKECEDTPLQLHINNVIDRLHDRNNIEKTSGKASELPVNTSAENANLVGVETVTITATKGKNASNSTVQVNGNFKGQGSGAGKRGNQKVQTVYVANAERVSLRSDSLETEPSHRVMTENEFHYRTDSDEDVDIVSLVFEPDSLHTDGGIDDWCIIGRKGNELDNNGRLRDEEAEEDGELEENEGEKDGKEVGFEQERDGEFEEWEGRDDEEDFSEENERLLEEQNRNDWKKNRKIKGARTDSTLKSNKIDSVAKDAIHETTQAEESKNDTMLNKRVTENQDKDQKNSRKSSKSLQNDPRREQAQLHKPKHVLDGWSLKALRTKNLWGIIVEGQRQQDPPGELWHSTIIVKRLHSQCLKSKTGSLYQLVGPIDSKETLKQGFSLKFVKAFAAGFPPGWKKLVSQHFELQNSDSEGPPPKRRSEPSKRKKSSCLVKSIKEEEKISTKSSPKRRSEPPNRKKSSSLVKSIKEEEKVSPKSSPKSLSTPRNTKTMDQLESSRSGRVIKPPLAWWRNQRIVTNFNNDITALDPGTMEGTPVSSNLYNLDLSLPLQDTKQSAIDKLHDDKTPKTSRPRKSQSLVNNSSTSKKQRAASKFKAVNSSTEDSAKITVSGAEDTDKNNRGTRRQSSSRDVDLSSPPVETRSYSSSNSFKENRSSVVEEVEESFELEEVQPRRNTRYNKANTTCIKGGKHQKIGLETQEKKFRKGEHDRESEVACNFSKIPDLEITLKEERQVRYTRLTLLTRSEKKECESKAMPSQAKDSRQEDKSKEEKYKEGMRYELSESNVSRKTRRQIQSRTTTSNRTDERSTRDKRLDSGQEEKSEEEENKEGKRYELSESNVSRKTRRQIQSRTTTSNRIDERNMRDERLDIGQEEKSEEEENKDGKRYELSEPNASRRTRRQNQQRTTTSNRSSSRNMRDGKLDSRQEEKSEEEEHKEGKRYELSESNASRRTRRQNQLRRTTSNRSDERNTRDERLDSGQEEKSEEEENKERKRYELSESNSSRRTTRQNQLRTTGSNSSDERNTRDERLDSGQEEKSEEEENKEGKRYELSESNASRRTRRQNKLRTTGSNSSDEKNTRDERLDSGQEEKSEEEENRERKGYELSESNSSGRTRRQSQSRTTASNSSDERNTRDEQLDSAQEEKSEEEENKEKKGYELSESNSSRRTRNQNQLRTTKSNSSDERNTRDERLDSGQEEKSEEEENKEGKRYELSESNASRRTRRQNQLRRTTSNRSDEKNTRDERLDNGQEEKSEEEENKEGKRYELSESNSSRRTRRQFQLRTTTSNRSDEKNTRDERLDSGQEEKSEEEENRERKGYELSESNSSGRTRRQNQSRTTASNSSDERNTRDNRLDSGQEEKSEEEENKERKGYELSESNSSRRTRRQNQSRTTASNSSDERNTRDERLDSGQEEKSEEEKNRVGKRCELSESNDSRKTRRQIQSRTTTSNITDARNMRGGKLDSGQEEKSEEEEHKDGKRYELSESNTSRRMRQNQSRTTTSNRSNAGNTRDERLDSGQEEKSEEEVNKEGKRYELSESNASRRTRRQNQARNIRDNALNSGQEEKSGLEDDKDERVSKSLQTGALTKIMPRNLPKKTRSNRSGARMTDGICDNDQEEESEIKEEEDAIESKPSRASVSTKAMGINQPRKTRSDARTTDDMCYIGQEENSVVEEDERETPSKISKASAALEIMRKDQPRKSRSDRSDARKRKAEVLQQTGSKKRKDMEKTQKPFKKSAAKRGVEAVQESETEEEDVKQPRRTRSSKIIAVKPEMIKDTKRVKLVRENYKSGYSRSSASDPTSDSDRDIVKMLDFDTDHSTTAVTGNRIGDTRAEKSKRSFTNTPRRVSQREEKSGNETDLASEIRDFKVSTYHSADGDVDTFDEDDHTNVRPRTTPRTKHIVYEKQLDSSSTRALRSNSREGVFVKYRTDNSNSKKRETTAESQSDEEMTIMKSRRPNTETVPLTRKTCSKKQTPKEIPTDSCNSDALVSSKAKVKGHSQKQVLVSYDKPITNSSNSSEPAKRKKVNLKRRAIEEEINKRAVQENVKKSPKNSLEVHDVTSSERPLFSSGVQLTERISSQKNVSNKRTVSPRKKVTVSVPEEEGEHDEADEEVREWQSDEVDRLYDALLSIAPCAPHFWLIVAQHVKTKSAQECQNFYQESNVSKHQKNKSVKNAANKRNRQDVKTVTAVTGGVGTIKRKREIRAVLENNDEGYEDDIFDATPFKKQKMQLKFPFRVSTESDDDKFEDVEEPSPMYKTPSSRTPSNRIRPLGPLSASKTPQGDLISPSLLQHVNRRDVDQYIYKVQQGRKTGARVRHKMQEKAKTVKTLSPRRNTVGQFTAVPSEMFEVNTVSDPDSEKEDDYYWSDE